MRNILFIVLMHLGFVLHAQYTQCDSLYLPANTLNELVLGTVVEGDSVLVAVMMNNQTDFGIRFRRIGHDGSIGTEVDVLLPFFSVGPLSSKSLMPSSDGGFFLGVYTSSEVQETRGLIYKLSSDFVIEWERDNLHFESDFSYVDWNLLHITTDNNLLVCGNYAWHSDPGQGFPTHFGVALTKYTTNGDTLWSKVIDFGQPLNYISKIYELPNGELLLTGYWDNFLTSKSVIYKVGANGEYWDKIVQGPAGYYGITPVGFYHNGKFYAFIGIYQDEFGGYDIDFEQFLYVLNIEEMTWEDQVAVEMDFESQPTSFSGFLDAVPLGDGKAVLAFTEDSALNAEPDIVMLMHVDTTGNVIWERDIPIPDISDFYLQTLPTFLDPSSDGGYTINGYFTNMEISQAHWYVKTDPCGQVLPYACDPTGVAEAVSPNLPSVFPSPANDVLMVQCSTTDNYEAVVYNMQGQPCLHTVVQQGHGQLDIEHLAPGIYHLRTRAAGSVHWTSVKWVKE